MKIKVNVVMRNGDVFFGRPKEVIGMMRKSSRADNSTGLGYKLGVMFRANKFYGKHIRYINDIEFLIDIAELGEISEVIFFRPGDPGYI